MARRRSTTRRTLLATCAAASAGLAGCASVEDLSDFGSASGGGSERREVEREEREREPDPSLGAPFEQWLHDPEILGDGVQYNPRYVRPSELVEQESSIPDEQPTVDRAAQGRSQLMSATQELRFEDLEERFHLTYEDRGIVWVGRGQFPIQPARDVLQSAFAAPDEYGGYELYGSGQFSIGISEAGGVPTYIEISGETPEEIFRALVDAEAGDASRNTTSPMAELVAQTLDGPASWIAPDPNVPGIDGLGASVRIDGGEYTQRVVGVGVNADVGLGGVFDEDDDGEDQPREEADETDVLEAAGYPGSAVEEWRIDSFAEGIALQRTVE